MTFPSGSTNPDDLAALVAQQAEQIRILQAQVDGLLSHLDPITGELTDVHVGFVRFDKDGIEVVDDNSGSLSKEAVIRFTDRVSGGNLGTIGSYYSTGDGYAKLDIYANMNHKLVPFSSNGLLEMAVGSADSGSSARQNSYLFTWAGEGSTYVDFLDSVYSAYSSVSGWSFRYPFLARYIPGASEVTLLRIQPGKATAGHPADPENGFLYWSAYSSGIYLYANGGWRTLSSW